MEGVAGRSNMPAAYRREVSNRGVPDLDGMSTGALKGHLQANRPRIKEWLPNGVTSPPVRKVWIFCSSGNSFCRGSDGCVSISCSLACSSASGINLAA